MKYDIIIGGGTGGAYGPRPPHFFA